MQKKNSFEEQQKDLDASYKQSLQNKKERESMEVKDIMKKTKQFS